MARIHPEIYFFGGGVAEGRANMRDLLGGKGANLAEMAALKLPVPPGFCSIRRDCIGALGASPEQPRYCTGASPTWCPNPNGWRGPASKPPATSA